MLEDVIQAHQVSYLALTMHKLYRENALVLRASAAGRRKCGVMAMSPVQHAFPVI